MGEVKMNEEQARERIEELRGFYGHLAAYGSVNLFLFMINMVTSPGFFWFIFPLFGWGIGLFIHAFGVFWSGADWEARKLQELTGLSNTQDELARLSERTENLIAILSSVNWDKIDPELMHTKESLEAAKQNIVRLREGDSDTDQEEVVREIEKLEEFVTSSKFDYYALAAEDKK